MKDNSTKSSCYVMFSIPVHERLEVLVDQLLNFKHFNPNSGFVIHFSKEFDYNNSLLTKNDFLSIVNKFNNVYINPNSLRTGFGDIIQAHLSNFVCVKNVDFIYFAICASNELFIKPGVYKYMKKADCGVMQNILNDRKWAHGEFVDKDIDFSNYLLTKNVSTVMLTRPEGQFYKKALFEKVEYEINSFYNYKKIDALYPREEVYFPTIIANLSSEDRLRISSPFNYSAYHFTHLWDVTKNEVDRLISSENEYYSVKRVDRKINDCVRAYIRDSNGYNEIETDVLLPYGIELKSFSGITTNFLDCWKYVHSIARNIPAIFKRIF